MNLLQNKRKRENVTFDSQDFIKDADNNKSIQSKTKNCLKIYISIMGKYICDKRKLLSGHRITSI